MTELEQRLEALAAEVEWPETPPLVLPGPAAARFGRVATVRGRRRLLAVCLAVLVLAAAVAAIVPGARSTILDWFRIGGVTVERVESVPTGVAVLEAAYLGDPVSRARAEAVLGASLVEPAMDPDAALFLRDGTVASVLTTDEATVLLERFRSSDLPFALKKLAAGTRVDFVEVVPGAIGAWLAGAPHVVLVRSAPARLAGNVLVWEAAGITYRLEGPALTRSRALAIARQVTAPAG